MSITKPTKPVVDRFHFYSDIEDKIQTGDLIAWRITRFNSFFTMILFLYQRLFGAMFSHVAVAVRVGGRVFAIEATNPQVRMIPLWMLGNFYLFRTGIVSKRNHFDLLAKHLGKAYSLLDMIKNMLGFDGSDYELYCSELANKFYDDIGFFIDVIDEHDNDILTPDKIVEKIVEQCNAVPEFVRIDKGNIDAA